MSFSTLIFDVDGTLADTEDAHRCAFNEAFASFGHPWHWEPSLYARLLKVGGGRERLTAWLREAHPGFLERADAADTIAEMHRAKTRLYQRRLTDGAIALRPGIARLIGEARRSGVRLAIATTTSRSNVDTLLTAQLGPEAVGWFACIAAGEQAEAKKPAPDVYRWLLDQLGAAPDDCLALEDSANGLASAQAAGIDAVITVTAYTRNESFAGALARLSDLGEPEKPMTVLAAPGETPPFVDLGVLQRWHQRIKAA